MCLYIQFYLNGMKISINRCHIRHMPLLRRFVNYSIRVDAIYYEGMVLHVDANSCREYQWLDYVVFD